MVPAKFGYIRVMGDEVLQKAGELVALPQGHVTPHQVLMHHTQVEVVAERVNVHQISNLIALLGEQHRQLWRGKGYTHPYCYLKSRTCSCLNST